MDNSLSHVVAALTSVWALLGFAACLLIISVILARLGLRNINVLVSRALPPSKGNHQLDTLIAWGALDEGATDEARERLLRQYLALSGYRTVGAALAAVLFAALLAGFALASPGAILTTSPQELLLGFLTVILLFFIIGDTGILLGYRFGSARLRRAHGQQPASEIRTLGDLCTPWLWAIPLILATAGLSVNLYLGITTGMLTTTSHAPASPALVVASLLLIAALQKPLLAQWIANTPNSLVTNDSVTEQRANDCSKAHVIASGIGGLWLMCMLTLEDTMMFWTANRPALLGGVTDILIIGSGFVVALMFMSILGLMTVLPSGHMGGRLTGWG